MRVIMQSVDVRRVDEGQSWTDKKTGEQKSRVNLGIEDNTGQHFEAYLNPLKVSALPARRDLIDVSVSLRPLQSLHHEPGDFPRLSTASRSSIGRTPQLPGI